MRLFTAMAASLLVMLAASQRSTASDKPILPRRSTQDPASCSDTNQLMREKNFRKTIAGFFGPASNTPVDYLYRGSLAAQAEDVLGGPPDDRHDLPDGGHLFTACRAHSCTEKGAIAFGRAGKVTAIAIVSFHCGTPARTCSGEPFLDLYVRDEQRSAVAREAILAWAMRATAEDGAVLRRRPILHRLAS